MKLSSINNLLELFFIQYEKQLDKNKILLSSLKEPKKKNIVGMKLASQ